MRCLGKTHMLQEIEDKLNKDSELDISMTHLGVQSSEAGQILDIQNKRQISAP